MQELDFRLKLPPTPQNGAALAEIGANAAREVSGLVLDYSPESLDELDDLVGRLAENSVVSQVAETLFCLGCYLGEVLIRSLNGRWVALEDSKMRSYSRWPLIVEVPGGHAWNPIGKIFKRFELGEGESLSHFHLAAHKEARQRRE